MTLARESVPKSWGRDASTSRRVKKQAFERDRERNAPCWICGKPINYAAKPGNADAYEPDHYLTVAQYPEFANDIANLRPAHSRCNRSRGAKDRADARWREELGEPSEDWGL